MNLSSGPLWLPVIYLLIHTGLILLSKLLATEKMKLISINALLCAVFLVQIEILSGLSESGPGIFLVLWGPVIFFWWAYLWSKHTLLSVYPPDVTLDKEIISFEERSFGQPALWWARKGNRFITEVLHIAYSSYYFYTLGMGIYLDASGRVSEFQVMTFSVMFGYLISYSLFALTPVHGPRWSLVEEGLLNPSEQYQKGYAAYDPTTKPVPIPRTSLRASIRG